MLTKLSTAQIRLIETKKNEWIDFALFNGDEIDQQACYDGIDFIYELSGLKKPVKIVVDSPLGVQYAVVYAKALMKELGQKVHDQVHDQVYAQVRDQVYAQVRDQVDAQVRDQVRDQVDAQVRDQVDDFEYFAYETLGWRTGWTAYLDYFKEIGIFKDDKWDKLVAYNKSGQFMGVYLDGLAVVCRRPQMVYRDEELRLHSDQFPAISWRDGFKLYFIHGQAFDEKLWTRITSQKMTLKEVMEIKNADQRTMAWSMLRPDRLLKGINAQLINTGIKGTRLYKVDNFTYSIGTSDTKEGDTEYCMVMDDSSTDRQFLEWTPPEVGKQGDAELCQAHAFGIPLEDWLLIGQES